MKRRTFLALVGLAPAAPIAAKAAKALPVIAEAPAVFHSVSGNRLLTPTEVTRHALKLLHKNLAFNVGKTNDLVEVEPGKTLTVRMNRPFRVGGSR